ncbi:hypothetical protein [Jatrophihabitans sp.]|uniref:hypothetical protein n=1 Tax=Jatrophihabitans sp. TaxID=1932789 RepID=UPI002B778A1D|nr:hypothetical protein [Jatrophihabitans sp.]
MVFAVVILSVALAVAVVALAAPGRGRWAAAGAGPAVRPTPPLAATDTAIALSPEEGGGRPFDIWELLLLLPDAATEPSRLWLTPWPASSPGPSGHLLPAGAPLARAVQEIVRTRAGRLMVTATSLSTDLFFRFEASPELLHGIARGMYEIMPSVSGGYRSPVRTVAAKTVVGHGSYVPAGGGAAGADATAAAAPALAPVLLVAAVTAGLEMAVAAEQRRQLQSIRELAAATRDEQIRQQIAGLEAAARRLDLAARSVIDAGFVPTALGIDSAADTVSREWQRSSRKLQEWRSRLAAFDGAVNLDQLSEAFPGIVDLESGEFWREIALYRTSLALHTRATLLSVGEAVAHDPDHAFPLLREGLQQHADELDAGVVDLRAFAAELASVDLKLGRLVSGGTANQALAMTRRIATLSADLAHPEPVRELPAAIGPGGSLQLEGLQHRDGSITLLAADKPADAVES